MVRTHWFKCLLKDISTISSGKAWLVLVLAASCLSSSNCYSKKSNPENSWQKGKYKVLLKDVPLWVDIADNEEERTQGLMNRRSLHKNEGMLFVFESSKPLSFWMKNTFLPLDIAFIDEHRTIISIQSMKALDESARYSSPSPARYALEVSQGWFASHGISIGDKLSF